MRGGYPVGDDHAPWAMNYYKLGRFYFFCWRQSFFLAPDRTRQRLLPCVSQSWRCGGWVNQEVDWGATVDRGVPTPTPINHIVSFPSDDHGRTTSAASSDFLNRDSGHLAGGGSTAVAASASTAKSGPRRWPWRRGPCSASSVVPSLLSAYEPPHW